MRTLFDRGLAFAHSKLGKAAGGKIIYRRGEMEVWIGNVWGRTGGATELNDGVLLQFSDRDFIIPRRSLALGGRLVAPERGDRIMIVDSEAGTDRQVFEALAPEGMPVYEITPDGESYRVHTKRVV